MANTKENYKQDSSNYLTLDSDDSKNRGNKTKGARPGKNAIRQPKNEGTAQSFNLDF